MEKNLKHPSWNYAKACLQSAVDLSFWAEFTKLKLHSLKLSEDAISVEGSLPLYATFPSSYLVTCMNI